MYKECLPSIPVECSRWSSFILTTVHGDSQKTCVVHVKKPVYSLPAWWGIKCFKKLDFWTQLLCQLSSSSLTRKIMYTSLCILYKCKDYTPYIYISTQTPNLLNYMPIFGHFTKVSICQILLHTHYDSLLVCTCRHYIITLLPTYVHMSSYLVHNLSHHHSTLPSGYKKEGSDLTIS